MKSVLVIPAGLQIGASTKEPFVRGLGPVVCAIAETSKDEAREDPLAFEPLPLLHPPRRRRPSQWDGIAPQRMWVADTLTVVEASAGQARRQTEPGLGGHCSLILPCIYPKDQCLPFPLH